MAKTGHAMPWPFCADSRRRRSLHRCFLQIFFLLLTFCACTAMEESVSIPHEGGATNMPAVMPYRTMPRPAWEKGDEVDSAHCPTWECPAGQRPVQKKESDYRMETWEHCPNHEWTELNVLDEDAYGFYQRAMSPCCQIKYLCVQTCGVPFDFCWKKFWKCALSQCNMARDILTVQRNQSDMGRTDHHCKNIAVINGMEWLTRTQKKTHGGVPGEDTTCKAFKKLQGSVCDCVPKEQWEDRLKLRAEEFFSIHAPQVLDAKGRLKNKKMWKAYRGKRYELMFDMVTTYSAKAAKKVKGPKPLGRPPSKSAQDMLEGRTPESMQKLLPGPDGKLQIAGNSSNTTIPSGMTRFQAWHAEMIREDQATISGPRPKPLFSLGIPDLETEGASATSLAASSQDGGNRVPTTADL